MRSLLKAATIFGTVLTVAASSGGASAQATQPAGAYFSVDGDRIFYRTDGSGAPMLLVHGFPLNGNLFNKQFGAFNNIEVITVDLPGFGRSTTATTKQTETHYASELLALMAHLGISKAIIGGHSMGGQVVLEMYRQNPTVFRGMILFDTNPAAANLVEQAEWPAYGQMAEAMGSASIAPLVAPVMVTGQTLRRYDTLRTQVTQIVSAASPDGVAGGGNALATRLDYTAMLGGIGVPTLVVEGLDDTVYPTPIALALAAAIPGSTLGLVASTAHASMFESPSVVNAQINTWLATVP